MNDRHVKALLFAIALGLWMNVVGAWARPAEARQSDEALKVLHTISDELHKIAVGLCLNDKIC